MTDQLLRLFEAVNAVAEGRLSGSDFEALIDEFSDRLEEVAGALPEPPVLSREGLDEEEVSQLEPIEESLAQAGREIEEGFQELAGALGGLRRYPEALDKSCLVEGVRRVRDAAIRIQRAQARIDELAGASAASSRGGEALRSEPGPEEEGQRGLA